MITTINWRELVPATVAAEADGWQAQVHQAIASSVMVTGQALRAMKPQMPHGAFEAWWRQELGLKDRKLVSDLMAASELLEQESGKRLASLPPRTLAILQRAGRGSVLEAAVERLESGQRITETEAKRIAADAKGKRPGPTQIARLRGYLNDERVRVLSGYITARTQAETRFEALNRAADLDPELARLSNDERVEMGSLNGAHPLARLLSDTLKEVVRLAYQVEDYKEWAYDHPLPPPAIDDPIWEQALGDANPIQVYQAIRAWAAHEAKSLAGHRDPEGAIRLWTEEVWVPRDRPQEGWEALAVAALGPWEAFAKAYLETLKPAAQA